MGFLTDIKDTVKSNKKVMIVVIVIAIIIGVAWGLLRGGKKMWSPPRDINREYRGEIIQKLRKGDSTPSLQDRREVITPRRREQRERQIAPPPANERDFTPRGNETYSDF